MKKAILVSQSEYNFSTTEEMIRKFLKDNGFLEKDDDKYEGRPAKDFVLIVEAIEQ